MKDTEEIRTEDYNYRVPYADDPEIEYTETRVILPEVPKEEIERLTAATRARKAKDVASKGFSNSPSKPKRKRGRAIGSSSEEVVTAAFRSVESVNDVIDRMCREVPNEET